VKKTRNTMALAFGVIAMMVLGIGAAQAAAATRQVAVGGSDAGNCLTAPCATIQHAVEEAAAGDTVQVGPGTYSGTVNVNKSLTLLGAQAGVDARNRNATGSEDTGETVLSTATGNDLTLAPATTSTVDGFKIINSGGGSGIFVEGGENHIVRNDIFFGITDGYASNGIFKGATFRQNRVENVEYGFESDLAPGPNTTIDANKFVDSSEYDINFIEGGTGVVISNNERVGGGTGNFAVLFKTNGAQVTNNYVTEAESSAVFLGGATENTTISGNTFTGVKASGVSMENFAGTSGLNRSMRIVDNTLTDNLRGVRVTPNSTAGVVQVHSNRIVGNSTAGVINEGTGAVDATANWWGCNTGPNTSGCDTATGPIDSADSLVLRLTASPNTVYSGVGRSQLAADLTRDAAGDVVGSVPDTTPIAFATSLGSIEAAEATTDAGRAGAQLNAGSTLGTADVTVTLDGAVVHTPVQVIEAPAGASGQNGAGGGSGTNGAGGTNGTNGTSGANGTNGSNEGSVALKRKMSLKFLSGKATVTGGKAAVNVRCLGSTAKRCVGTLKLTLAGKTTKVAYSVAAGKTATLKVAVGSVDLSSAGAATTAAAVAVTQQSSGGAATTKRTLHLS
jgi:hypothetical protein